MADISLKWLSEPFSSVFLSEKNNSATFKINYGEVNSFILGNYRYTNPNILPLVQDGESTRTGIYARFLENSQFFSDQSKVVEADEYIFSPYSSLNSGTLKNFDVYTKGEAILQGDGSVYLKIPKIPLGYQISELPNWYPSLASFVNDYKIDLENTGLNAPTSSGIIERNYDVIAERRISKEGEFGPSFYINIFNYKNKTIEQNLRSNIVFPFRAGRLGDLSSRNASIIVTVVAQPKLSKTWQFNPPRTFNFELLGWEVMDLNLNSPDKEKILKIAKKQMENFFENEIQSISNFQQQLIFPETYNVEERTDDQGEKYTVAYPTSYLTYASPINPDGTTQIVNPHYLDYNDFTFKHEGGGDEDSGVKKGENYLTELNTTIVRILLYHKKNAGGKIHIHKIYEKKLKFKYIFNRLFNTFLFMRRFYPYSEDDIGKGTALVKVFKKEDAFAVGSSAIAAKSSKDLDFFEEEENAGTENNATAGGGGEANSEGNGRGLQSSNPIKRGSLQGSTPLEGGGLESSAGLEVGKLEGARGLEGAKGLGKNNGGEILPGGGDQSGGGGNLYDIDSWAIFYGFEEAEGGETEAGEWEDAFPE